MEQNSQIIEVQTDQSENEKLYAQYVELWSFDAIYKTFAELKDEIVDYISKESDGFEANTHICLESIYTFLINIIRFYKFCTRPPEYLCKKLDIYNQLMKEKGNIERGEFEQVLLNSSKFEKLIDQFKADDVENHQTIFYTQKELGNIHKHIISMTSMFAKRHKATLLLIENTLKDFQELQEKQNNGQVKDEMQEFDDIMDRFCLWKDFRLKLGTTCLAYTKDAFYPSMNIIKTYCPEPTEYIKDDFENQFEQVYCQAMDTYIETIKKIVKEKRSFQEVKKNIKDLLYTPKELLNHHKRHRHNEQVFFGKILHHTTQEYKKRKNEQEDNLKIDLFIYDCTLDRFKDFLSQSHKNKQEKIANTNQQRNSINCSMYEQDLLDIFSKYLEKDLTKIKQYINDADELKEKQNTYKNKDTIQEYNDLLARYYFIAETSVEIDDSQYYENSFLYIQNYFNKTEQKKQHQQDTLNEKIALFLEKHNHDRQLIQQKFDFSKKMIDNFKETQDINQLHKNIRERPLVRIQDTIKTKIWDTIFNTFIEYINQKDELEHFENIEIYNDDGM